MFRVRCPTCRGETLLAPANPWRPFCSERCKLLDLAAWAEERYRIPGEPLPTTPLPAELEGDPAARPRH
jgi:endogenous inhibitor of DNA gyrase (YacG/DUF329 family)